MQEKKIALNFISAHLSELDSKDQELIANAKNCLEYKVAFSLNLSPNVNEISVFLLSSLFRENVFQV